MKIEFKNGSSLETIGNTSVQGNIRGKRANISCFAKESWTSKPRRFAKRQMAKFQRLFKLKRR